MLHEIKSLDCGKHQQMQPSQIMLISISQCLVEKLRKYVRYIINYSPHYRIWGDYAVMRYATLVSFFPLKNQIIFISSEILM